MTYLINSVLVLHICASAVWLGTAIFTEVILTPSLGQTRIYQASVLSKSATKMAVLLVWISLILLSSTGLALMWAEHWLSFSFLFGGKIGIIMFVAILLTVSGIVNGLLITLILIPKRPARVVLSLRINMILALAITVLMILFSEQSMVNPLSSQIVETILAQF